MGAVRYHESQLDLSSNLSIVHILDKTRFDTGSVHQMFQAADGLRARGHVVTIVSRDDSTLARRAREHSIRFVAAPFGSEVDLRTIAIIRQVVREEGANVIHVHKGRPHSLALAATWRHPVGAFVVNRGVSFPLTVWNRAKYRTRRVDRVVTVCENIRQVVIRSGRLPPAKVEVIYAGTDTERFDPEKHSPDEFRDEKGIPREAFLIVQVGVREWKGWRELIEALALLRRDHPRARLALIACRSAGQISEVRAFAASFDVGDFVTPVEVRDDMPRVLASADCVADASWAGTGITGTIREGMAMGRPVVATDTGGNRELVCSPEVGWLVPPRDPEAFADALREIIADGDRRGRVGASARALVRERFSQQVRISRLEDLYRTILGGKQRG
jgi:glycosyltransferase involved in cell wall biosynthesis